MASRRIALSDTVGRNDCKRAFAKAAFSFAKRAAALPGFPMLSIGCLVAAGLMVVTGGFGTGDMPLGEGCAFWLLLMGWNGLKWQLWFAATVRKPRHWWWAPALGAPLLNLPLPLEIGLCLEAVGEVGEVRPTNVWASALAISALIAAAAILIALRLIRRPRPKAAAAPSLLTRAGIAPATLAGIEAEDHYCRVHGRDGRSALVHYRFGEALMEVGGIDGAQVHRGAWAAADAVRGAERDGRRWRLLLEGGAAVPVSSTYAAEARRRHWLRAPPRREP